MCIVLYISSLRRNRNALLVVRAHFAVVAECLRCALKAPVVQHVTANHGAYINGATIDAKTMSRRKDKAVSYQFVLCRLYSARLRHAPDRHLAIGAHHHRMLEFVQYLVDCDRGTGT